MARSDGIRLFINDMNVLARREWLGGDDKFKKQLEDVARIGREVISYEDMLNTNTALLDKRYPHGFPPFAQIKSMDKPVVKKLCEASARLMDSTVRYQQAMNALINEATPEIMRRLGAAYGFTDETSIRKLQSTFAANAHLVDNIADIATQSSPVPDGAVKVPDALMKDMGTFLGTITSEDVWLDYFRDDKKLGWLANQLEEPKAASPMIMIKALSAINTTLTFLTDRNRQGRDHLRRHWPQAFEGIQIT